MDGTVVTEVCDGAGTCTVTSATELSPGWVETHYTNLFMFVLAAGFLFAGWWIYIAGRKADDDRRRSEGFILVLVSPIPALSAIGADASAIAVAITAAASMLVGKNIVKPDDGQTKSVESASSSGPQSVVSTED